MAQNKKVRKGEEELQVAEREQKKKKKPEKGCTEPLNGKKAKCVLKIVPQETREKLQLLYGKYWNK